MGDRFDEMVDVIDKILKTRNMTPSQQKLMAGYRDRVIKAKRKRDFGSLINELFGEHLRQNSDDIYGERMRPKMIPDMDPHNDIKDRETVGIREFLPNKKILNDELFIEPSRIKRRNPSIEL